MQVVCEEAPQGYNYGARTKMKNRFIGGVVTPAQPQYLYSMMEDRSDAHDFQESPPILGIAAAVGGYKVSLQTYVTTGLCKKTVLSGDHGDRSDLLLDLFGSPHMLWGLQDD